MKQTILSEIENADKYPNSAYVRLPVVKGLLGVSSSTVWRLVKAGKLRVYRLTPRTTTFNMGELRAFFASQKED